MEERVSRLEGAYEQVNERLGDMNATLGRLEARMEARMNAMMAVMITGFIAIGGGIVAIAFRL